MSRFNLLVSSLVLGPMLAAAPAQAQRVSADIRIGSGPVDGRVIINDPYQYRRSRPVLVFPQRRVFVERVRFDRRFDRRWAYDKHQRKEWEHWRKDYDHWRRDWYNRFSRDYRVSVVYYDGRDDCYYDRFRPGLQEIRVYERDGRFYRFDDDDSYYDDSRSYRDDRDWRRDQDGWDRDR